MSFKNTQAFIKDICLAYNKDFLSAHNELYNRLMLHSNDLFYLFQEIYGAQNDAETHFTNVINLIIKTNIGRSKALTGRDKEKAQSKHKWFLSNQLVGMSLYVDRFCGDLKNLPNKLSYLEELGVNYLHLMPLMESPANESDGGYAVSNFRKVDAKFGTNEDFAKVQKQMQAKGMYLMMDIVLNHTSHHHEWANKAKAGDPFYQDYFYCFENENEVGEYNNAMPEIFPESSPGSFTYNNEMKKWVMTVFHNYQWDLNFSNPYVFSAMLDNVFYYANIGVDVLRIDAPAFIWKQKGTTCQNLPQAHTLLRLIKACVQVAAPGMALLGEAIVAPKEIMKYFGTDFYLAKECDIAYGATNMALQWDALATTDTTIMQAAQTDILKKPYGTTWVSYTRCHDDIGLGYDDSIITQAGYNAYEHRSYLKEYYSGMHQYSTATGALFSVNPKTGDARISGTLASLCGLEKAIDQNNAVQITAAINKIILMQAQSIFVGGIPMLFYGDEIGYTNDYSFLNDVGKNYDNRWMHRPIFDWEKADKRKDTSSTEARIFSAMQQLINIKKQYDCFSDLSNVEWLSLHNKHIAGFIRANENQKIVCLFNYSNHPANLTWYALKEKGITGSLIDIANGNSTYSVGADEAYFTIPDYGFSLLLSNQK